MKAALLVIVAALVGSSIGHAQETGRTRRPETFSGGILNRKAVQKPNATYPEAARAARVSGVVVVRILVDEKGKVENATAVSGHPLLREAAVDAAYQARFTPTRVSGNPVKVSGTLVYRFVLPRII